VITPVVVSELGQGLPVAATATDTSATDTSATVKMRASARVAALFVTGTSQRRS
jgi:hypothetical protein